MNEARNAGGRVQLVLLGGAALAVAILLLLALQDSRPPVSSAGSATASAASPSTDSEAKAEPRREAAKARSEPKPAASDNALRPRAKRAEARQRADAIRREISARAKAKVLAEPKEARAGVPTLPEASKLKDRIGLDPATQRAFHEDFMPLVDECIGMARERGAALTGVLQINMGMIGDEDLGAVVDALSFGEKNLGLDAELLECVRESGFSLSSAPPPKGGRADVMFTVPFEDEP